MVFFAAMLFHHIFFFQIENQVLLSLLSESHIEWSGNYGIRNISAVEVKGMGKCEPL